MLGRKGVQMSVMNIWAMLMAMRDPFMGVAMAVYQSGRMTLHMFMHVVPIVMAVCVFVSD